MPTRRFAILEHTTDQGVHHDLLIDRPDTPDPLAEPAGNDDRTLWAARCAPPPAVWRDAGPLTLTPLPPHRYRYLTYQGPLSDGRGTVRRVAQGHADILRWDANEKTVRLAVDGTQPPLTLHVSHTADGLIAAVQA